MDLCLAKGLRIWQFGIFHPCLAPPLPSPNPHAAWAWRIHSANHPQSVPGRFGAGALTLMRERYTALPCRPSAPSVNTMIVPIFSLWSWWHFVQSTRTGLLCVRNLIVETQEGGRTKTEERLTAQTAPGIHCGVLPMSGRISQKIINGVHHGQGFESSTSGYFCVNG